MSSVWVLITGMLLGLACQSAYAGSPAPAGIREQKTLIGKVYANGEGLTLYSFIRGKPGKPACTHSNRVGIGRVAFDCLALFHPFAATGDGKAVGDWSVITWPEDGTQQWAFQGFPVYLSIYDTQPGSVNGEMGEALFMTALAVPHVLPPGIIRRYSRYGVILATPKGMPLYTRDQDSHSGPQSCMSRCADVWPPLYASHLATPVGDFTVVARADGTRQWAYKEKPLHTYSGDSIPGQSTGDGIDTWRPVVVEPVEPPPSGITITETVAGDVFADSLGRTLYYYVGTHALENGMAVSDLRVFKEICGTECGKLWQPVLMNKSVELPPSWTEMDRPDGTKQLFYRGRPLYTFYTDKQPGDIDGSRYGRYPHEMFMPVLANTMKMETQSLDN
jgi:predicted lipoprotein with Yx(FWY)xxD motif